MSIHLGEINYKEHNYHDFRKNSGSKRMANNINYLENTFCSAAMPMCQRFSSLSFFKKMTQTIARQKIIIVWQ